MIHASILVLTYCLIHTSHMALTHPMIHNHYMHEVYIQSSMEISRTYELPA